MRKLPLVLVALLAPAAATADGQLFAPVERELAATAPSRVGEVFDRELRGGKR